MMTNSSNDNQQNQQQDLKLSNVTTQIAANTTAVSVTVKAKSKIKQDFPPKQSASGKKKKEKKKGNCECGGHDVSVHYNGKLEARDFSFLSGWEYQWTSWFGEGHPDNCVRILVNCCDRSSCNNCANRCKDICTQHCPTNACHQNCNSVCNDKCNTNCEQNCQGNSACEWWFAYSWNEWNSASGSTDTRAIALMEKGTNTTKLCQCKNSVECDAQEQCFCYFNPKLTPEECGNVCLNCTILKHVSSKLKACYQSQGQNSSNCTQEAQNIWTHELKSKTADTRALALGASDPAPGSSTPLIVGLVVAILLALIAAGVTAYYCFFKKSGTEENSNNKQQAACGYQPGTSKALKSSKKTSIGGGGEGGGGGGKSIMKSACLKSSKANKSSKSKKSSLKKSGKTISSALKSGQKPKKSKASSKSNKSGIKE